MLSKMIFDDASPNLGNVPLPFFRLIDAYKHEHEQKEVNNTDGVKANGTTKNLCY